MGVVTSPASRSCSLAYCMVLADLMDLQDREHILAARETEFSHSRGITYLDHAGATLYSSVQLQSYFNDLSRHLYGNPHSQNPSSKLSSDTIDQIREKVLTHFNTSLTDYEIIFTSGCTGALKLLAECFPWNRASKDSSGSQNGHHHHTELYSCVQGPTKVLYLCTQRHSNTETENSKQRCLDSEKTKVVFGSESIFCYLEDNHTSVVGMRETAASHGAKIVCVKDSNIIQNPTQTFPDRETLSSSSAENYIPGSNLTDPTDPTPPFHLFVYPAQSNFCGRKYPLNWTVDVPLRKLAFEGLPHTTGTLLVALDAASLVSTSPLDLASCPAHFVTISFYKMFGFPTGLGALLVRRDCCEMLKNSYYGGGTVAATLSRERYHVPRDELHERLEDGTISFLSIVALSHGFDALYRIGRSMEDISHHTFKLAQYVYIQLSRLRHHNGSPVCTLYCHGNFSDHTQQGPIVNFNLVRPDGRVIGYSEVDKLACVHDIHLRTGCFCNTGACMSYLGMSVKKVKENMKAGHICGDSLDIINGEPTGSVRVSFGYISTLQDAQRLVQFIEDCFVDKGRDQETKVVNTVIVPRRTLNSASPSDQLADSYIMVANSHVTMEADHMIHPSSIWISVGDKIEASCKDKALHSVGHLSRLTLYPIKSCAGQSVSSWPLGEKGLLFDREWMIVGENGAVISLKQEGNLCLVQPIVNLSSSTLTLTSEGHQPLVIPLHPPEKVWSRSLSTVTTRVCGDRIAGLDHGEEAADWLSRVLNRRCRILRQNPDNHRLSRKSINSTNDRGTPLSLANEAQYLLVTESSVDHLCTAVHCGGQEVKLEVADCVLRLRPNFVVSSKWESGDDSRLDPYIEEQWERVKIRGAGFIVNGHCSRCQMICVDPASGVRSPEPLKTLMELRGSKVPFGLYLSKE